VLSLNPTKNLELKTRKVVSAWMIFSTGGILDTTAKPWLSYVTFSGGFRMGQFMLRKSQDAICPKTWILEAEQVLRLNRNSAVRQTNGRS
jgi:hypothetical protein